MELGNMKGYELVSSQELKDIDSKGYLLRHTKSGARVFLVSNDDDNKVFSIAFRTPPIDSTGLTHILEHSVLCGSREFPVKDPFVELAKGSMNTFLNALTYPDKTVYPIASTNDKDFQNLMHVYLDAVFFPNIYDREEIFRQEGWHYELEDEESDLNINGVVYNEMKGAFSSPEGVLEREILNSLFPDTPYRYESGGDPENIPELSYERFLDFHSKYYHPSNSYIYLYGDMDMEEKLSWLDEHYLSRFDKIDFDTSIALQKPFSKPRFIVKEYSVTEDEPLEENTYLSLNYCLDDTLDRKIYQAFSVIDYALLSSPGAPLKQALLDAGIGRDILSTFDPGLRQPTFSIISKNADEKDLERFLATIEDVLKKIVDEGINKKRLLAGINSMEFSYREADTGRYPVGLMNGFAVLDSWLYDDNDPYMHLKESEIFEFLKKQVGTDYFENLISEKLLGNPHRTVVTIRPKRGLTGENDKKLKEKLKKYKESLSKEEISKIVRDTKHLKKYQEEPSTPEELKTIPLLSLSDMKKKAMPYQNREVEHDGIKVLYHDIPSKGICYICAVFGASQIPYVKMPYLSLLTQVLSFMDTKDHDYKDLADEIDIYSGGLSSQITIGTKYKDDEVYVRFGVSIKTLFENIPKTFLLLSEVLTKTLIEDDKRLKEILDELRSKLDMQANSAGHMLSSLRASSYFSPTAAYLDETSGIGFYKKIKDLAEHFDEKKEEIKKELKSLLPMVFNKNNVLVDITGEGYDKDILEGEIKNFVNGLFEGKELTGKASVPMLSRKNEGFKSASKVNYVCRAGNFKDHGFSYSGHMKVLKILLSYDYLWLNVRVLGGAYGVMNSFDKNGDTYFVSYRDPNLRKTEDVFEGIPEYLEEFDPDERDMTKYIIGTISSMDTPLSPQAKGRRSLSAYITGTPYEHIQKIRDEVLSTSRDDIRSLSWVVRSVLEDGNRCIIGDENEIVKENGLFDTVESL